MALYIPRGTYLSEQRDYRKPVARSQRLGHVAVEIRVVAKQLDLKHNACILLTFVMPHVDQSINQSKYILSAVSRVRINSALQQSSRDQTTL